MNDKKYGWICPKCGAVMAPWKSNCDYCIPNFNITAQQPSCWDNRGSGKPIGHTDTTATSLGDKNDV